MANCSGQYLFLDGAIALSQCFGCGVAVDWKAAQWRQGDFELLEIENNETVFCCTKEIEVEIEIEIEIQIEIIKSWKEGIYVLGKRGDV